MVSRSRPNRADFTNGPPGQGGRRNRLGPSKSPFRSVPTLPHSSTGVAARAHELFAEQVLQGLRAVGPLQTTPPVGELPPVTPHFVAPAAVAAPGFNSVPYYSTPAASPYTSWRGPNSTPGTTRSERFTTKSTPTHLADDLTIQHSLSMLGNYSPYRGLKSDGAFLL